MELAGETSCARSESGLSIQIKKQQVRPTSDGYGETSCIRRESRLNAQIKKPQVRPTPDGYR